MPQRGCLYGAGGTAGRVLWTSKEAPPDSGASFDVTGILTSLRRESAAVVVRDCPAFKFKLASVCNIDSKRVGSFVRLNFREIKLAFVEQIEQLILEIIKLHDMVLLCLLFLVPYHYTALSLKCKGKKGCCMIKNEG